MERAWGERERWRGCEILGCGDGRKKGVTLAEERETVCGKRAKTGGVNEGAGVGRERESRQGERGEKGVGEERKRGSQPAYLISRRRLELPKLVLHATLLLPHPF